MKGTLFSLFILSTIYSTAQNENNSELFNFNLNNSRGNIQQSVSRGNSWTDNNPQVLSNNRGRGSNQNKMPNTIAVQMNVRQQSNTNVQQSNANPVQQRNHTVIINQGNINRGRNLRNVSLDNNDGPNEVLQVENSVQVEMPQINFEANLNLNVDVEINAPKIDIELPKIEMPALSIEKPEININFNREKKGRTFQPIVISYGTSSASEETKSKSSRTYYSQKSKNYTGMKIKVWCKKHLKFAKKIRFSVSCPEF